MTDGEEAGLRAALAEAKDAASPAGPIPHDGWKSRKAIGSSVAAGIVFVGATAALFVSGLVADQPFFTADQWLSALRGVVLPTLAIGWGLLTAEKFAAKNR